MGFRTQTVTKYVQKFHLEIMLKQRNKPTKHDRIIQQDKNNTNTSTRIKVEKERQKEENKVSYQHGSSQLCTKHVALMFSIRLHCNLHILI